MDYEPHVILSRRKSPFFPDKNRPFFPMSFRVPCRVPWVPWVQEMAELRSKAAKKLGALKHIQRARLQRGDRPDGVGWAGELGQNRWWTFFFAPFLCGDIGYMRAEKYRICMGTKEILKMKIRTSKWALAITLSNGISTAWELGWSEQNGSGIEQVHPPGIANWEGTHAGVLPFLRENHWHHLHHL